MIEFEVGVDTAGTRLDRLVHERVAGISRSEAQRLVDEGLVTVDGAVRARSLRVQRGMAIRIEQPERAAPVAAAAAPDREPRILFEDEHLVVVDKPAGLTTHAAPGTPGASLASHLAAHGLAGGGDADRPGIVHRLDRDTSGVLVVARDADTLKRLGRQMRRRAIEREYVALVHGRPPSRSGRIEAPIGRDPQNRTRRAIDGVGARDAVTHFTLEEALPEHSLLAVRLETGRTHQIRVHLAAIGHPVVGDPVYGSPGADGLGLDRQALHARRIGFEHPHTGAQIEIEAPLPPDLEEALRVLRAERRQPS
ncbi:MAG: RluA family pseudouridine synthase [Gaiellales bacterium]